MHYSARESRYTCTKSLTRLPPDMCHQLQRLFVQCPFIIRVGPKWVRAPRTERDAREAVAMDPETEHADANMYKDDGDGDGGDMKAKVYKTVWSPEVRPRSPRKPEVLPARVRRLELFRSRSRFRSRSSDRALDRAPDRRASFP